MLCPPTREVPFPLALTLSHVGAMRASRRQSRIVLPADALNHVQREHETTAIAACVLVNGMSIIG